MQEFCFDNHDERIRYCHLQLESSLAGIEELPLPAGYHYEFYAPGDRDAWIAVEKSAREFQTYEDGLRAWARYYAAHEEELPSRMFFVVTEDGEKVATATAFYDVFGHDLSGDAWLHWVAVCREHQGKGLSKPLITHTIARMRELGYTRAKIPTQTTTWLACKIYLSLGFVPTPDSLAEDAVGWRILRRLSDAPALAGLSPATDEELLAPPE